MFYYYVGGVRQAYYQRILGSAVSPLRKSNKTWQQYTHEAHMRLYI